MSYPIVILGAGASFDYIHEAYETQNRERARSPLANGVFDSRFAEIIKDFSPVIEPLSAGINLALKNSDTDLETYLESVKKKALTDEVRQRQLIVLRFYLQRLFKHISDIYGGQPSNNYSALMGYINDYTHLTGEEITIVTFNYDLLLDQALEFVYKINHIDDCIKHPIKVIKVHGACNWRNKLMGVTRDITDSYEFLIENPGYLIKPAVSEEVREPFIYSRDDYIEKPHFYYPAVAIPLANKDMFVCPDTHINVLKKAIAKTDKILIIGWKAGDTKLIKLLEDNLQTETVVTVVSSNEESVKYIQSKLKSIKKLTFVPFVPEAAGFSNFVSSSACDSFFDTEQQLLTKNT